MHFLSRISTPKLSSFLLHNTTCNEFSESVYICTVFNIGGEPSHRERKRPEYYSIQELELFQCRNENGYNLTTDKRYNQWLKVHHPQECKTYAKALIKVFMVVFKLSTAIRLHSESGLVTGRNRDGSGQAEKDTGRHGVFSVVCFKMCAHPLQSLYSYQTSFREWPLSCKKQRWIRTSREGYRTSWCVHCCLLQNVCPPPTISLQLPDFVQRVAS